MSAKRCVWLLKHLAKFKNVVGKLFAKHMKLKEQVEALSSQKMAMAIGTPHRIAALADAGALVRTACILAICRQIVPHPRIHCNLQKFTHTTHIVVDCTYKDAKQRSIFDEPCVRRDLMQLYRKHLHKLVCVDTCCPC